MRRPFLSAALAAGLAAMTALAPAAEAARKCTICPRPIPDVGRWASYTIDGEKYLVHADDPDPPQCDYCGGLMSAYGPWGKATRYADGREVCKRCVATAVNDVRTAQAAVNAVRGIMTGWGMAFPWGQVPVKLVGQSELNRIIAQEHPGLKPDGICQPTLRQRPGADRWEVTNLQIYMLTGLPGFAFEKTAAHELTHAWMALNGCPNDQAGAFREGACNLAAYFYLQQRGTRDHERLKRAMLKDPDPVYGEGLRRQIRYATDHRVSGMLAILKSRRDFPPGY